MANQTKSDKKTMLSIKKSLKPVDETELQSAGGWPSTSGCCVVNGGPGMRGGGCYPGCY